MYIYFYFLLFYKLYIGMYKNTTFNPEHQSLQRAHYL